MQRTRLIFALYRSDPASKTYMVITAECLDVAV